MNHASTQASKQASKQAVHYSPAHLAGAVILSLVFIFSITSVQVSAATQTVPLDTTIASDDIHVGEDETSPKLSDLGVSLEAPLDSRTTNLDATTGGAPVVYTWRATLPALCEGAQIDNIRLITNTESDNEAPIGGVIIALYDTSRLVTLKNYTINIGEDGNTWIPAAFGQTSASFVDRGLGDGANYFLANLGYDGAIDAVWDVSNYNQNNVGIYIQHWIADGPTTIQTTIGSVDLTYDDANCVSTANQASNTLDVEASSSAQLAATGSSANAINLIATTLLITASASTALVWLRKQTV